MATVLEFRALTRAASPPLKASRDGTSAEIVFFPGVRYERWDEKPAEKPKRGKSRRDQLELED